MTSSSSAAADERDLLAETAQRLFAAGPELGRIAELGLLGLLTPEAAGGSGWLPEEAAIVAWEAGRALASASWAGTSIAAAAAGSPELAGRLLAGEVEGAVAGIGGVTVAGARATGSVRVTSTAPPGVLVLFDGVAVHVIEREGPGATEVAEALDTTRSTFDVELDGVRATTVGGSRGIAIVDAAALVASADTAGALAGVASLLRHHLSERSAFGRPIASFQAIQHRLADLAVLEATWAAMVRRAGRSLAAHAPDASRQVAALHAHVGTRASAALDDCIQLAGGIGFTWEWPAHHALRRAVVNAALPRPPRSSVLALVDGGDGAQPDDAEPDFRRHARATIRQHMPFEAREGHRAPVSPEEEAALRAWYRTLYDEGLLGASWPEAWGGRGEHQPLHDLIVTEELIRARAPRPIDQVMLATHVLLSFGSPEQQARHLPRIRSGEAIWCQLFSEPDAGSDLAGIKARAERRADGSWRLSGQKTWTTDGHWAQMGLALLRTETGSTRHHGITAFAVPMDAPGVEVQPKRTIGGAYEFNDVFLDGVVLTDDDVIGPVGDGWAVAMSGLEIERFGVGGNVLLLSLLLGDVRAVASALLLEGRPLIEIDDIRAAIGSLAADAWAAQSFVADHVDRVLLERAEVADSSIAKVLHTETYNRISRFGAELLTIYGPVGDDLAEVARRIVDAWLWSRAITISGGSSEVMRNIIATRRLHLPR